MCLPVTVLDELDRFKDKPGLLGESARTVNRYLDGLRSFGKLNEGVYDETNDITVKILVPEPAEEAIKLGLDASSGDNRIISAALDLRVCNPEAKICVITKDINLRVKCNALGIDSEDFYKDHLPPTVEKSNASNIIEVDREDVEALFKEGSIERDLSAEVFENKFAILRSSDGASGLAVYSGSRWHLVKQQEITSYGIKARNKEQHFALHALRDSNISLVCLTGIAGSGKTFLALMSALESLNQKGFKRIVLTRPIQTVGKDIGFLPGDLNEKMSPWLAPVMDNFRHAFSDVTYFETMISRGTIEVAPMPYIRGRTFSDCIIIVDEAQNATVHELKTVITRTGDNSKIILLGDTDQIDTPYIDKRSNGLSIVSEKLRHSPITATIHLSRGERSKLATLASNSL